MAKKIIVPDKIRKKFAKQTEFASELALVMNKAGSVGLYATMQQLHEAVRVVGHEIEGQMLKAARAAESKKIVKGR